MKRYFDTLLQLFSAGIEPLRCNQTHSVSNIQLYYSAGDIPAKEKSNE